IFQYRSKICFPEDIYVSEDTIFVVTYLLNCHEIIVSNNHTYCYVHHKATLSELLAVSSEFDKRGLTVFLSYDRVLKILPHSYKRAITYASAYKAWEAIHVIRHIYYLKVVKDNKSILSQMVDIASKNKYIFYKTSSFSLKLELSN
ncbi:hypothetical protein OQI89_16270, partial [Lentilactobacillus diolivorans]|uniref:hypothetical protein n=1 Tax=Lentilactobacillus diolivorans TaxID=179838 RepID=UPI0024691C1F